MGHAKAWLEHWSRQLINAKHPIASIPPEIMLDIFSQAVEAAKTRHRVDVTLCLSHVASHWSPMQRRLEKGASQGGHYT